MFRFTGRTMGKVLVVVETSKNKIAQASLSAITAGLKVGPVTALVAGNDGAAAAAALAKVKGIDEVLVAKGEQFDHGLAEEYASLVTSIAQKDFTHVFAATSAFGKGVIPRAAAKCDAMPISDITNVKDESTFERLMYAGNVVTVVKSSDKIKFATVRGTSFDAAPTEGGNAKTSDVEAPSPSGKIKWLEDQIAASAKVDLSAAKTIVTGGRGLKNKENFKLLYDLAEPLNAAVGATRAVVDAGYCSNDMQVGQTGKTVAPNFYLACGVSGAIQHISGMKDSKVIAVINTDEDAPFFQVADYGLVGDLFDAVPKLTNMLKK